MKAILTKFLPATNTKGSRIKAYDGDNNSITIPFDHELSYDELYKKAAVMLCNKMNWSTNIIGGSFKGNYVFVFHK